MALSEYIFNALYIAAALAREKECVFVPAERISEECHMTEKMLKISVRPLLSAGIAEVRRGNMGGYRLAVSPDAVRVRSLISTLESGFSGSHAYSLLLHLLISETECGGFPDYRLSTLAEKLAAYSVDKETI